jgi:hypothetical protein
MQALNMIRSTSRSSSSSLTAPSQMLSDSKANLSLFSSERVAPQRRERWTLSEYERLDQDDRRIAGHVRRLTDEWYRRLPAHARAEIRQRFTASSSGAHLGAFWEMYLHDATSRLHRDVDVDVGRDNAARRPYLLVGGEGAGLFLEATVALGDGAVRLDERARADQLYAAIERVNHRNFLLHTELRRVGETTPGRNLIADPLDRWLATLDPDAVRQHVDGGGPPPAIAIDKHGWLVHIEATAKKPELRDDSEMGVIGSRVEGFEKDAGDEDLLPTIDDITPLTNVLLKKAGHGYELGHRPFVIAVLCAGDFIDEHDIAQALFGRIEYRLSMDSDRSTGRYVPGGLWHDGAGPRYTRVSAVLTASNLTPSGVAAVEPRLWINPAASHPIDQSSLPWRRWEVAPDGRLVEHPATRAWVELFGLPPDWPAAGHEAESSPAREAG